MSEFVDLVKNVIVEKLDGLDEGNGDFLIDGIYSKSALDAVASAVIKKMRKPTREMVAFAKSNLTVDDIVIIWESMIDIALGHSSTD